jgi:hypothetical protein
MQLTVTAEAWEKYLKLKAQKASLEKEIKALEAGFDFPAADKFAADFAAVEGETLTVSIVNGNSQNIGKISVFWFPGAEMPAAWRKRIS